MPPCINATISIAINCDIIFQKWRGGSKAIWNFSKNSLALVAGPFPYTAETFVTAHTPYIVDDGKLLSLLKHCIYTVAYILCLHILPHVESVEVIRPYCFMGFIGSHPTPPPTPSPTLVKKRPKTPFCNKDTLVSGKDGNLGKRSWNA